MKKLQTGDIFSVLPPTFPNDRTALVNHVLGTHYKDVKNKAGFELFETPNVLAWFVYMDDTTHGLAPAFLWKNEILPNGYIREKYVSDSTFLPFLWQIKMRKSFSPYRLAFCMSPDGKSGDKSCKFMGAYMLDGFETDTATITRYKRVADTFWLGKAYEEEELEEIFLKDPKHRKPIGALGLNLKFGQLKYVSQLLNLQTIDLCERFALLNALINYYLY